MLAESGQIIQVSSYSASVPEVVSSVLTVPSDDCGILSTCSSSDDCIDSPTPTCSYSQFVAWSCSGDSITRDGP